MTQTIQEWAAEKGKLIQAYQDAILANKAACDKLSQLLKAKYGKWAGDMRYRPAETVEIAEAMKAHLTTSEQRQVAWLAYMAYKPTQNVRTEARDSQ